MRWVGFVVAVGWARIAAADYVNGASDDVREAEAVLIGHAPTADEAKAWPGAPRIVVDDVLVGVWLEHTAVVPAAVAAGARVVVLVPPRELGGGPEVAIEPPPVRAPSTVWAIGANDELPAELVADGADGGLIRMQRGQLTLAALHAIAAKVKPAELELTSKVIDAALLHPAPDPIAALYDIDRDVLELAMLLESTAPDVRAAAATKLRSLTSVEIGAPARTGPVELAAWRQRWVDWWAAHRDSMLAARNYPAVPAPIAAVKAPRPTLLATLDGDPAKLVAAVRDWLDGGALRDRELVAMAADESYPGRNGAGAIDAILDRKLPAKHRQSALATRIFHIHAERFAAERALAARQLETRPPCSERVRGAAYWELPAGYVPGPSAKAWLRLAACDQPAAVALIETMYRGRPDVAVMAAVAARVAAKDDAFARRLGAYVRATGAAADWAVSILDANGYDKLTIPAALEWLRSRDPDARLRGAAALQRSGAAAALPLLVATLEHETNDGARRMELWAIAAVADQRALAALLAAAKSPAAKDNRVVIANGLAHIKDPRALDVLAKLAFDAGDDDQQGAQEAVHAFCWISGKCPATAPSDSPGGVVEPDYIHAGLDAIRAWQKH